LDAVILRTQTRLVVSLFALPEITPVEVLNDRLGCWVKNPVPALGVLDTVLWLHVVGELLATMVKETPVSDSRRAKD
jgi:hypothetical protein